MKGVTRAQDEAEVLEKVKLETPTVTVPDGKTCRAGEVATKQPSPPVSENLLTKSAGQAQCRVVHELVNHQHCTNERDGDLPVSNMSTAVETPAKTPFCEVARRKKKEKKQEKIEGAPQERA
ncbi:hypothetical protein MTO96_045933 [Rhipicephalus appendiculatus]